ncbi:ThiF family adenylyltransferase [Pseudonocardia alni]|uniref:ThiF family adenylyltransferase n=1 Tax=Pseudonocardia alni TaxID=33907 RepID=UPI003407CD13
MTGPAAEPGPGSAASELAAGQLLDLAAVSAGAVAVLDRKPTSGDTTTFTVSLDTAGIVTANGGIAVRSRERFEFVVDELFPFRPPTVRSAHRRWAGTPHVQWGRQLCLYAATSVEWKPSDGMRGLISRLSLWLQRAAVGDLDPAGQPLHPPVTYGSYANGWIVVRPDLGELVPWHHPQSGPTRTLYAWCSRAGNRVDVLAWLTAAELHDRLLAHLTDDDSPGEKTAAVFVAPLVLVDATLDMEYPDSAAILSRSLSSYGCSRTDLIDALVHARAVNRLLDSLVDAQLDAALILLLGTPARRLEPGQPLAHLVAWRLDDLGADVTDLLAELRLDHGADDPDAGGPENGERADLTARVRDLAGRWLEHARIAWMVVHEARNEVTCRRDSGSASTWLRGKRVLLLGCGALGAPIGEQCVRAEVVALHVIDNGLVTPGILLRQPYDDTEIGLSKARQLATRLNRIQPAGAVNVTAAHENVLVTLLRDPDRLLGYDLIVDATADTAVRSALELARRSRRDRWPSTISGMFGHRAERGLVAVSRAGASGGPHDILRRSAIEVLRNPAPGWRLIAEDIFPDPPRTEQFFPEPGCSAPTFTGSATQVTALASTLFWSAIRSLGAGQTPTTMSVHAAELDPTPGRGSARALRWPDDLTVDDQSGTFEVRLSARALGEIRAEARRGARVRGPRIETGGTLLGGFDEATGIVHIDTASGPPPDSRLSAFYYRHGVLGVQTLIDTYRTSTADRVGFVGVWHTHPGGPARPSATDEAGIAQITAPDGAGQRALMLILGGSSERWDSWLRDGPPPDIYARVVRRGDIPAAAAPSMLAPTTRPGPWFAGGYSSVPLGPADASTPTERTGSAP